MKHSVFIDNRKHSDGNWFISLSFYEGDFSDLHLPSDSRFKEVPGKRKELIFLGICNPTFPVEYPLELENGAIIDSQGNILN